MRSRNASGRDRNGRASDVAKARSWVRRRSDPLPPHLHAGADVWPTQLGGIHIDRPVVGRGSAVEAQGDGVAKRRLHELAGQRQRRGGGPGPGGDDAKGFWVVAVMEAVPGEGGVALQPVVPSDFGPNRARGAPPSGNGIKGDARRSTAALGKLQFDLKVEYAVRQIRQFIPRS